MATPMLGRNFGSRKSDVIVVGGGHAGSEAALACARLGFDTLLVTGAIDRIAAMSCNPAIGGVGKGHLVKELDVLGGEMGRVADQTGIHFRTLNESRGPAVRATRCQSDMNRYQQMMAQVVTTTPNLRVRQDDVVELVVEDGRAAGVVTRHAEVLAARVVIVTTGTFLGGLLHRGSDRTPGGRAGEAPAAGLSASLTAHGLTLARLKTGTCPRLDARTIDTSVLDEQKPDTPAPYFSFDSTGLTDGRFSSTFVPPLPQTSCYLTRTTQATHDVITEAVTTGISPLFNGQIEGRGPRYCPSIEDKVVRFREKDSHLIFLEPHGLDTYEVYPNGLSTSMPPQVQLAFLRTIPGLEHVEVTRWGYAVEYDFVPPTQLQLSLETQAIPGLYCAGQINGTTGYEEAAMQGLLAGINAARALSNKAPIILNRDQAYAGVMVDDLVLKGTDEPYRMFTSRAEHRLLLREDNVAERLLAISDEVGLRPATRAQRMHAFETAVADTLQHLATRRVEPDTHTNHVLTTAGGTPIHEATTALALLRRPEVTPSLLLALVHAPQAPQVPLPSDDNAVLVRTAIIAKYQGYIDRAQKDLVRDRALDDEVLPSHLLVERLPGISNEVFEKLKRHQPRTLGQASRIAGVTPAAVGLLAVEVRKQTLRPRAEA